MARRGPAGDDARRAPAPPPRHPDGLSGPAGRARSPDDGGGDHRRAARHPRTGTLAERGPGEGGGDDGAGRTAARSDQPLSPRVLGGTGPAHQYRTGPRRGAAPRHLRRAGFRPRRERAGASNQPARRSAARPRPRAHLHRARLERGEAHLGSDHGVLSRPGDGARARPRPRPRPAPSLHACSRGGRPDPGPGNRARALRGRARGGPAVATRTALGVRFPNPLPDCPPVLCGGDTAHGRLRDGHAAACPHSGPAGQGAAPA